MQCSTLYGHTISKQLTVERRRGVSVTVLHVWAWFVSLPKYMPTVWIKQVLVYFTLLPPPRTCWCMGPMFLMLLPRLLLQNKVFTSALIEHSTNGGSSIRAAHPSPQGKLSPSSWQCKGTQSPHVSGRNMPTRFYVTSVSHPRYMNHVYTRE